MHATLHATPTMSTSNASHQVSLASRRPEEKEGKKKKTLLKLLLRRDGSSARGCPSERYFFQLTECLSLINMVPLLSTCQALRQANVKLYAPKKWRDGDQVRRVLHPMLTSTWWKEKVKTTNVREMVVGVEDYSIVKKVAMVTDDWLRLLVADGDFKQVERVHLRYCEKVKGAGVVAIVKQCQQLTSLDLQMCFNMTDDSFVTLFSGTSHMMTHLDLGWCEQLTDSGLSAIAHACQQLKVLDFDSCENITDVGLIEIARHCQQMTSLNVSTSNVTDVGLKEIAKHCQQMTSLNMCPSKITDVGLIAIAKHCQQMTNLKARGVFEHSITDVGVIAIAENCHQMITLDLQSSGSRRGYRDVTDAGVIAIARNCQQLTTLNLEGCLEVTDIGLTAIADNCRKMTTLNLRLNERCTDAGVIAIAKQCQQLIELNLESCSQVTDAGVIAIAEHCRMMKKLNLSKCHAITDVGLIAVAEHCQEMVCLWLRSSPRDGTNSGITDENISMCKEKFGLKVLGRQKKKARVVSVPIIVENPFGRSLVWETILDPASGKNYYHNRQSGVTTWDRPPELE